MVEVVIDVRERDEFEQAHAENSINVPLSSFATVAPGVLNQLNDRRISFMCRSGLRASQALEMAKGMGYNDAHVYSVYEGGFMQWISDDKPVSKATKSQLPLMRQMQIIVGSLLIISALLGTLIHPWFTFATIAFASGLLFAGVTGNCAVANLLVKAPWNKADQKLKKDYCQAAGNCQ